MTSDGTTPPDCPPPGPPQGEEIRAVLLRLLRLVAAEVARMLSRSKDSGTSRGGLPSPPGGSGTRG